MLKKKYAKNKKAQSKVFWILKLHEVINLLQRMNMPQYPPPPHLHYVDTEEK